jgi:hypothetical protein
MSISGLLGDKTFALWDGRLDDWVADRPTDEATSPDPSRRTAHQRLAREVHQEHDQDEEADEDQGQPVQALLQLRWVIFLTQGFHLRRRSGLRSGPSHHGEQNDQPDDCEHDPAQPVHAHAVPALLLVVYCTATAAASAKRTMIASSSEPIHPPSSDASRSSAITTPMNVRTARTRLRPRSDFRRVAGCCRRSPPPVRPESPSPPQPNCTPVSRGHLAGASTRS